MSIDTDTLTNAELAALDLGTLDADDLQDAMETLNDREISDTPPPELPDLDPPPSLDPTVTGTGSSPSGNGWALTFDDDGAVRTLPVEDVA